LIAAEHANVNRMKIQNHVLASELADRTLHPGQSMRGFVYFQSASRTPVVMQESLAIGLQAPNLSDDTNWDVVVPLMAFEGDGGR